MATDVTNITIMEENVEARLEEMPIEKLHFLPDNPRVRAVITDMEDFDGLTREEKQIRIYESMLNEPSVKNLIPEIRRDGGLQEPIIVRFDTHEVIEGNSRLAVYRKFHGENTDSEKWKFIKCLVVRTLTDDQQTRLLGQIHLRGKTKWSAYNKALFCYDWVKKLGRKAEDLAKLSGFSPNEIKKQVKAIELMQLNDDDNRSNYSYYDVLVRSRSTSQEIENILVQNRSISREIENDKPLCGTQFGTLLLQIKTEAEAFTAQEMRTWLPVVIKKPKIWRKFQEGTITTLKEACDRASVSDVERRLKLVRGSLDDVEEADLKHLNTPEVRAVEQVVKQIRRHVSRISKMVDKKLP